MSAQDKQDGKRERIQKILARAGISSRRQAEELIKLGEVTINGKPAQLGDKAEFGKDAIKVSGKLIHTVEKPVYLAFHKPKGVISMMSDPEGRATLSDFLTKIKERLFPVGRLDFNSEGLIILTNDGDFAERLAKLDTIPRVYHVKIKGHPTPDVVERIGRGARVGTRFVKPHSVRISEEFAVKSRLEVVLMESGAIDLKAYLQNKGFLVDRIVRTSIGHLTLHGLEPGRYRYLTASQVDALFKQPELGLRMLDHDKERSADWNARRDESSIEEEKGPSEDSPRSERTPKRGPRAISPRGAARDGGGHGGADEDRRTGERRGSDDRRGGKPAWGGKPSFGAKRGPRRDGGKPAWGGDERGDKPAWGGKPSFGAKRGPRRDDGDKPAWGGKPAFGAKRGPRRDDGGKPAWGEARGGFKSSTDKRSGARGPKVQTRVMPGAGSGGARRSSEGGFSRGGSRGPKRRG